MREINLTEAIATGAAIWIVAKKWIDAISKIVDPLIKEAEQLAQDGTIDRKDRKAIVMKAVALLEEQGSIKFNFITRFVVGRVVDDVARNLPDFKVSAEAFEVVAKAVEINV